jgi:hypothetical protein
MSEGGSQRSDEEEDEPEVKDARWERDKAIFMEREIERLQAELLVQKEKAKREAEATGEVFAEKKEAAAVAGEEKKEELAEAVAGEEKKEEVAAEPAPKPVYANVGLYGKAMSKEEQKARRLEKLLYR